MDLSYNSLRYLNAADLRPARRLQKLNLSHNKLVNLTSLSLPYLESLDVSHNRIVIIREQDFEGRFIALPADCTIHVTKRYYLSSSHQLKGLHRHISVDHYKLTTFTGFSDHYAMIYVGYSITIYPIYFYYFLYTLLQYRFGDLILEYRSDYCCMPRFRSAGLNICGSELQPSVRV